MNKRSVRSNSNYGAVQRPLMLSQPLQAGTQGIYSHYIYQDLVKLRSKGTHPARNFAGNSTLGPRLLKPPSAASVRQQDEASRRSQAQLSAKALQKIDEIMTRRAHPSAAPAPTPKRDDPPAKVDRAVQLSPIQDSNAVRASLLLSDKKCSLAEFLVGPGRQAVDTETCRHADNKYTIRDDNVCAQVDDASHFIGSNSKKGKSCAMGVSVSSKENVSGNNAHCLIVDGSNNKGRTQQECIVEEVLFNNEDEDEVEGRTPNNCIDIGTAEFKNPLEKESSDNKMMLKEKEAHVEILRKLLTKAMKIIKSLRDQINLLNAQQKPAGNGTRAPHLPGKYEEVLTEDVTEGNLEEIGNFLDALHNATTTENERLLSRKVELLAEKYGDEAKSLAETLVKLTSRTIVGGTNQFASPGKLQTKAGNIAETAMDTSLSPIHTPGRSPSHMSVHNEIMELYRQAEDEMEHNKNPGDSEKENEDEKGKAEAQMTFQQEDASPTTSENGAKKEKSKLKSKSKSRSRSPKSIRNWKTFVADNAGEDPESESEEVSRLKRKHNRSCAAAAGGYRRGRNSCCNYSRSGKLRGSRKPNGEEGSGNNRDNPEQDKKENQSPEEADSRRPKTDHRRMEDSLSIQDTHNGNDSLEDNLTHIEAAMSNFLGGFKDLKSELSQIGEVMQSCNQPEANK